MMRARYEAIGLVDLKAMARNRGIKITTGMKKIDVVEAMLLKDEEDAAAKAEMEKKEAEEKKLSEEKNNSEDKKSSDTTPKHGQERSEKKIAASGEEYLADLDSGKTAGGILEVMTDGFGFIRCENYLPGENDIYISPGQIRRFSLRTGDILEGHLKVKNPNEKFAAMLYITTINGFSPEVGMKRHQFENMTPIFPNERIKLAVPGAPVSMRIMDLLSPVGKGQRGMIVSPPKAGKTTILHTITGLLSPKKGSVVFEGTDITKVPAHKIVSMGMAHVPEGRRVFAQLSVYENLKMGAYTRKDKAEIDEKIHYVPVSYKDFIAKLKEQGIVVGDVTEFSSNNFGISAFYQ